MKQKNPATDLVNFPTITHNFHFINRKTKVLHSGKNNNNNNNNKQKTKQNGRKQAHFDQNHNAEQTMLPRNMSEAIARKQKNKSPRRKTVGRDHDVEGFVHGISRHAWFQPQERTFSIFLRKKKLKKCK